MRWILFLGDFIVLLKVAHDKGVAQAVLPVVPVKSLQAVMRQK
jgi:hypothetical protein